MTQLLVLAILLLLAIYGLRRFLKTAPLALDRKLRQAAFWLGAAVLIVLLATGRLGWVAALAAALVGALTRLAPLILQLLPLFRRTQETGEASGRAHPSSSRGMSHDEAYEILGLEPGASRQQVIEAHRRLIQKIHPDRGGSAYLAAKLNQARDILLTG